MHEFWYDCIKPKNGDRAKLCYMDTDSFVIKRRVMFENYKDCFFNGEIILKSQQRLKNDCKNVCTEQINKIALSSNDDKRLQTFDKTTTYPCGTNALKVCEREMLGKHK